MKKYLSFLSQVDFGLKIMDYINKTNKKPFLDNINKSLYYPNKNIKKNIYLGKKLTKKQIKKHKIKNKIAKQSRKRNH